MQLAPAAPGGSPALAVQSDAAAGPEEDGIGKAVSEGAEAPLMPPSPGAQLAGVRVEEFSAAQRAQHAQRGPRAVGLADAVPSPSSGPASFLLAGSVDEEGEEERLQQEEQQVASSGEQEGSTLLGAAGGMEAELAVSPEPAAPASPGLEGQLLEGARPASPAASASAAVDRWVQLKPWMSFRKGPAAALCGCIGAGTVLALARMSKITHPRLLAVLLLCSPLAASPTTAITTQRSVEPIAASPDSGAWMEGAAHAAPSPALATVAAAASSPAARWVVGVCGLAPPLAGGCCLSCFCLRMGQAVPCLYVIVMQWL